jgi:hypothetical protein
MILACLLTFVRVTTPQNIGAKLDSAIRNGKATEYSIYVIDPAIMFRAAMTPERLRYSYSVCLSRQDLQAHPERVESFVRALKHTKFRDTKFPGDMRYAISVDAGRGNEILWLCMDGSATIAYVDGHWYLASGKLGPWFARVGRELLKAGKSSGVQRGSLN